MTRDATRTIGAISGLVIGLGSMTFLGMGGLVTSACFGAGGSVIGGMLGERFYDRGGHR